MKKFFTLILLCGPVIAVRAQTTSIPGVEQYGKVSQADMDLKKCDFEPDANAEVLFNAGRLHYENNLYSIVEDVHKRIKIFNDNGKKAADIRIVYYSGNRAENITGIEAQTINLVDGKVTITKIDKKLIYNTVIDKALSEIKFTLPDVKPGCIIEYKYTWTANYNASIPAWYFQENIPVRYCEFSTAIPDIFYFRPQSHFSRPLIRDSIVRQGRVLQVFTHSMTVTGRTAQSSTDADTYPYTLETETRAMAN
ncbi:MAG TPA: DUF3857 domain-containing protein, partial [Mucilaginibacter sp.]|nr:DUF3857 domain-containing protein [Mucilaginibacter sp.]